MVNRIFQVDDKESILQAMKKIFEQKGYEVITALSGEEAG